MNSFCGGFKTLVTIAEIEKKHNYNVQGLFYLKMILSLK